MEEHARDLLDAAASVLGESDVDVVVRRTLSAARRLTGASIADVGMLDGAPDDPFGQPSTGSSLRVPIVADQVLFGSLDVSDKDGGGSFTLADETALTTLAGFAGVAIGHAHGHAREAAQRDELARTVSALEATTEIARTIGGETDLGVILELLAKRGRVLVAARSLIIEIVDDSELVVAAADGDAPPGLLGRRIALADTVASTALRAGITQRLDGALNRARFDQHGLGRLGVSAEAGLVVPLIFHGRRYGVLLALDQLESDRAFTAHDQRLLEAFATSAATAVATAQAAASELQRQRVAAAEDERGRWARELHDETLQSLGGLRILLSGAQRRGGAGALAQAVTDATEHLDQAIAALRALVIDLRPPALDELGLEAALDALTERVRRNGLAIDSSIDLAYEQGREKTRPTPELETALYRISQEALTNATKHGHAARAVIEIREDASTIRLTVRDDGSGFDPSGATDGFGVLGMRERVALLGGTLTITSAADAGTTVVADFPVRRVPAAALPAAPDLRTSAGQ